MGGRVAKHGGAVYAEYVTSLAVTRCVFVRNTASIDAGAIYLLGDAPVHVATERTSKASSMTVWEFERADKTTGLPLHSGGGNALGFDDAFRLLHVSTGRVLARARPGCPWRPCS